MVAGINRNLDTQKTEQAKPAEPKAAEKTPAQIEAEKVNQKAVEAIHQATGAEPSKSTKQYHFEHVTPSTAKEAEVKKHLARFGISDEKDPWKHGLIEPNLDTFAVVVDGKTSLKQFYGGANAFSRFFNKIFGWLPRMFGGADKAIVAKKYAEYYNASHEKDKDGFKGEPLSHLMKGLASNHYHTLNVFVRDPQTGKFKVNPSASVVIDSDMYLAEADAKRKGAKQEELDGYREEYLTCYSADKVIPIDMNDMNDLGHITAEALYAAQPYKMLRIPGKIHQSENMNTNDLNYVEVPSHRLIETNDSHWKVAGSSDLLKDSYFETTAKRKEYEDQLMGHNIDVTYVRPKEQANEPINENFAKLDALQQIYAGGNLRTKNKKDLGLIEEVTDVNKYLIAEHNAKLGLDKQVTEKLTKKPDDKKEGMMARLKKLFGGGKKAKETEEKSKPTDLVENKKAPAVDSKSVAQDLASAA